MSTLRQIEANRRNSQHSTGPRTPEGKAVSRFNALKSGIDAASQVIPGEDPADLQAVNADYRTQFAPATPLENFLVDSLVYADWQMRRLRKIEAQLWRAQAETGLDPDDPKLLRLQRRIDAAERTYYRALKQLQRLQSAADTQPESDPAPGSWPPAPEMASFLAGPPTSLFPAADVSESSPSRCEAVAPPR